MKPNDEDLLRPPSDDERDRLNAVWRQIAGDSYTVISPKDRMDIWLVEHRVRAERQANARLTRATWVLVLATVVLAAATIALVVVTLTAHQ